MSATTISVPTALIVGHPGHELRILRCLELLHPVVFVLTDGSGRSGAARIASSREVVSGAGCAIGGTFGRFTDHEIYRAVLTGEIDAIAAAAVDLANEIVERGVRAVICDEFDFYNPTHDLCAVLAGLAVARARAVSGRGIERYDFSVTAVSGDGITIVLDDDMFERKIATARRFQDLAADVDELVERVGIEALRHEVLRPIHDKNDRPPRTTKPYYELRGEEQVAAGRYDTVLRYKEHFLPAIAKLTAAVAGVESGQIVI